MGIFADDPSHAMTTDPITIVVVGLASLIGLAVGVKKLFFDGTSLRTEIEKIKAEQAGRREELDRVKMDITKLDMYAREEIHGVRDELNKFSLRLASLIAMLKERFRLADIGDDKP